MTPRGRSILGLGFGVYIAAWGFGSKPLYPVATGLLLVVAVAWVWVRLANRPFRVRRGWGDSEHVEGDNVPVIVELEATTGVLPDASSTAVAKSAAKIWRKCLLNFWTKVPVPQPRSTSTDFLAEGCAALTKRRS